MAFVHPHLQYKYILMFHESWMEVTFSFWTDIYISIYSNVLVVLGEEMGYRIAGNLCGEFNFADCGFFDISQTFHPQHFYLEVIVHDNNWVTANIKSAKCLFCCKSQYIITAKISGYTVYCFRFLALPCCSLACKSSYTRELALLYLDLHTS